MSVTNRFTPVTQDIDIHIKLKDLKVRTGISDANLRAMEVPITSEGVNIWTLLFQMNKAYKEVERAAREATGAPVADPDLELMQKEFLHEKLMGMRIKNQESLAELIPKDYAEKRSFSALEGFGNLVQTTLESASFTLSTELGVERARVEAILTQEYMKIYNKIEETSVELVEWSDEDATKTIMRTRISRKYSELEADESTASELVKSLKKHEKLTADSFNNLFG